MSRLTMATVNWFITTKLSDPESIEWEISLCLEGWTGIRSPKLRLNSYRVGIEFQGLLNFEHLGVWQGGLMTLQSQLVPEPLQAQPIISKEMWTFTETGSYSLPGLEGYYILMWDLSFQIASQHFLLLPLIYPADIKRYTWRPARPCIDQQKRVKCFPQWTNVNNTAT